MENIRIYTILGYPLGLKMSTLGTYRVKIRALFAETLPGCPRVPKNTSKSEVLGGIFVFFGARFWGSFLRYV